MDKLKVYKDRDYKIYKANLIIQRARYDLNVAELKALAFILSKVQRDDPVGTKYKFTVSDYLRALGLTENSGKNYADVKKSLKILRDTSFWLMDENGVEQTVGWLDKAWIYKGSGKITVMLDETLHEYVVGLYDNFTQYKLIYTLPMRSAYSFRVYELLKSYAYQHEHTFNIDELKSMLMAERYKNFKDFRKCVIEVATREINLYTDIEIQWEPITKGRKVIEVKFIIVEKGDRVDVSGENTKLLDGQITLNDFGVHGKRGEQEETGDTITIKMATE